MGPNNKNRSRKQYVKYRLQILRDCEIEPPSQEVINKMLDDKTMSEIEVDNIFLGVVLKHNDKK
jgi:hypothetical protein